MFAEAFDDMQLLPCDLLGTSRNLEPVDRKVQCRSQ